jgi:hypothetical protein
MRFFAFLICIFCFFKSSAQDTLLVKLPDSTRLAAVADTSIAPVRKKNFMVRFIQKDYPNPRRAALFSTILPGSGQIYNRSWWKVPLVYGALGGTLWNANRNAKQYRILADNYRRKVDRDPDNDPTEAPYASLDATTLREYRDQWKSYTDRGYLLFGLAYLLSITDAFVDAHLKRFDVSDDLSLQIKPDTKAVPGFGTTFGMGITLNW